MLTKHLSVFHKNKYNVWCLIDFTPLRPTKVNKGAPITMLFDHLYSHWHSGNALFTHLQTSMKLLNINKFLYTFCSTLQDSGFIHHQISEKHNLFSIGMVNVNLGRDSSVGIGTRYGMDCPGIESRWGARFSAPVHTCLRANPASYTVGTGSLTGVSGRGVALTTHPI
jgi:hypothetical protein